MELAQEALNREVDNANLERWAELPSKLEDVQAKARELAERLTQVNETLAAMAAEKDQSLDRNRTVIEKRDLTREIGELRQNATRLEGEFRQLTTVLTILTEPGV